MLIGDICRCVGCASLLEELASDAHGHVSDNGTSIAWLISKTEAGGSNEFPGSLRAAVAL